MNKQMKYEFKVGDYVETISGDIGYISSICHCEYCKDRGFYEPEVVYKGKSAISYIDYITVYEAENGFKEYKRIGTYDFTDKNQKQLEKIEKLPYEKTIEAKGRDNVVLKRLYLKLDQEDIIDKLNEVIDRVNEIGGKNE